MPSPITNIELDPCIHCPVFKNPCFAHLNRYHNPEKCLEMIKNNSSEERMINTDHLENGDRVLVSIERENSEPVFDIPCVFNHGLLQDEETNEVYGSRVFNIILVSKVSEED